MQGITLDARDIFLPGIFVQFKDILPGIPSPPRARLSCFLAAEDRLTIFRYDTDSAHFSHRPPLPRPTASFVAFE